MNKKIPQTGVDAQMDVAEQWVHKETHARSVLRKLRQRECNLLVATCKYLDGQPSAVLSLSLLTINIRN